MGDEELNCEIKAVTVAGEVMGKEIEVFNDLIDIGGCGCLQRCYAVVRHVEIVG